MYKQSCNPVEDMLLHPGMMLAVVRLASRRHANDLPTKHFHPLSSSRTEDERTCTCCVVIDMQLALKNHEFKQILIYIAEMKNKKTIKENENQRIENRTKTDKKANRKNL